MLPLFGIEIDIISLIPALFGALLSIYNFYKMSKPADIVPTEIVNYGIISSGYENAFKMVLPLVFHNEGSKNGIIKNIKFGFKCNDEIKYFDSPLKARLNELTDDLAQLSDWNKFNEHGYRVVTPTYPIPVLSDSSVDVVLVATANQDENIIPIDKQCEYIIEVYFGKNKIKTQVYPFYLAKDDIPDDRLIWLSPRKTN